MAKAHDEIVKVEVEAKPFYVDFDLGMAYVREDNGTIAAYSLKWYRLI